MGNLGCGCALSAVVLAMLTAFPFVGWGNWVATLPAAVLAILFSLIGLLTGSEKARAAVGLVVGVVVLFWALIRLALGGGVL